MSKPILSLFYAKKGLGGGTTTYTVHMQRVLRDAGIDVHVYHFRADDSKPKKATNLGEFEDTPHEYVTQKEAVDIVNSTPSLLLSQEHPQHLPKGVDLSVLMRKGMRVVVHDPEQFKYHHLKDRSKIIDPIAIRPSMLKHLPTATFIPHPYHREFAGHQGGDLSTREAGACIARLTYAKRPKIILEANRRLPANLRLRFHGQENRMMTYFTAKGGYPEMTQGGYDLPFIWGVSARMIRSYAFMPDMTRFKYDGGGSQYTFMEAWDAGSVVIVHCDWLYVDGEMKDGFNCLAVAGPKQLASLIRRAREDWEFHEEISANATRHLEREHNGFNVANQYLWTLTGSTL